MLNPYFLAYALQSHSIRNNIFGARTGTALKRIIVRDLRRVIIPVPSLLEQQKIASILSKVDELIQKTELVIEQTQRLKKVLMERLLTKGIAHKRFNTVRLYNDSITIPEQWTVAKLKDYTTKLGSGITHLQVIAKFM